MYTVRKFMEEKGNGQSREGLTFVLMSFGKNIISSAIGSTLGLLVAGTVLIFIFVGVLVGGLVGAFSDIEDSAGPNLELEDANILKVTLSSGIVERGGNDMPFSFSLGGGLEPNVQVGLNQILDAFDRAAGDDQIDGVFLNVADVSVMPSMMEDLRAGLGVLKDSGKFVVAWSETMSQRALHFNSAADEVYLHPQGGMALSGLRSQSMFYPGMFEKLGISVTVVRGPNNKYKSAVEPFFRKGFSAENREQTMALLEGFWQDMAQDVEASRGLPEGALDDLANDLTIRSPQDAVEAGLVDGLLYEDELTAVLTEKLEGESPEFISLGEYTLEERFLGGMDALAQILESAEEEDDDEEDEGEELGGNVAVIYAVGAIESGQGDAATIGSETVSEALRQAREADDVEAVVLRVNSPGGSALASDVIWRETILLKEAGKPFVVSMSDLAASGGYYISCAADRIYANPTTITGSIGVFGMIPNLGGMLEKHVGISFDEVALHDHAGQPDGMFAPDDVTLAAINESVTDVYEAFTSRVAEGRGMTKEAVEQVARGRVWTGLDALEAGLVDEMGDLEDAVQHAAFLAEIAPEDVDRVALPEATDPFESFVADLTGAEMGLQALGFTGVDPDVLHELWQVRRMVESGDPIQARMPYTLHIH